jgi:GT2 family glycosyltransferase
MVSIIILNYNGKEFLKDCLNSVFTQSFADFEIIFVDNGSNDDSLEFVKNNFTDSRLRIFSAEKNLGFAGGNNFGLKYAKGSFIVLLNNDTVVEKDWLKILIDTIESDEQIGIVQSLVYTEGIPEKYYKKNGTINLFGHNIMEVFDIDENGTGEIIQATACSLIVRKDLLDKTGGLFLDEYFLYAEDTFLSLKAKFAGLQLLHNSKSVVHHKGGGTTKKQISSDIYYYQERNRLLNFFLFFDSIFIIKYILLFILNYKLKFFYCLFSGRYSMKGLFRSYFWFLGNIKWIKNQRRIIKSYKIVSDNDILKLISCKIFNGNNIFERVINSIILLYCKLTGIKVFENAK